MADYYYLCMNGHHVVAGSPDLTICGAAVSSDGSMRLDQDPAGPTCGAILQRKKTNSDGIDGETLDVLRKLYTFAVDNDAPIELLEEAKEELDYYDESD